MSNPEADFRQSLVAAVQKELERHAAAIVAEVDRVRKEGADERAALRKEVQGQIAALTQLVQQAQQQSESRLESRLAEAEQRQTRRVEDMTSGIDQMVANAARPVLQGMTADNARTNERIDALGENLRRFDQQAARLVEFVSQTTQKIEARQNEVVAAVTDDVQGRLGTLTRLVEDNESNVRRFQNEIGQMVTGRLNDAEDRINTRLMASETRVKEDSGAKIADVQALVGRVQANIDDTLTIVNARMQAVDDRFHITDRRINEVEERVAGVDQEALDELSNKMSAAVGEAMLVRIEMERFEKNVNERTDTLAVRLTEVETELQDVTMDVSTAVQLDRLEEIERALIELDPNKFVLKDGVAPLSGLPAPGARAAVDLAPPNLDAAAGMRGLTFDDDDAHDTHDGHDAPGVNGVKVDHGAA